MKKCNGRYHELFDFWAMESEWPKDRVTGICDEWTELCRSHYMQTDYIQQLEDLLELEGIELPSAPGHVVFEDEQEDAVDEERTEVEEEEEVPDAGDVLATVDDLVLDFMYYDRKGAEVLPLGTIEKLLEEGAITVDEIANRFRAELKRYIKNQ
jgi:hypothetical protein